MEINSLEITSNNIMKRIVKSLEPQNVITVDSLLRQPSPIIGIEVHGKKGWFQRINYRENKYIAIASDGVGSANGWTTAIGEIATLEQWIDWANSGHPSPMFLFDSERELFEWLLKK